MVVKYTLKTPISWGENETITELTVRRPTAGDFRGIELKKNVEVSFDDMLTLASRTTGTEKAKLERMDVADMTEVYSIPRETKTALTRHRSWPIIRTPRPISLSSTRR